MLVNYQRELQTINRRNVSMDETIDHLFGEVAGLEYALAAQKL